VLILLLSHASMAFAEEVSEKASVFVSGKEIKGRVVDYATKQALIDVTIVVTWLATTADGLGIIPVNIKETVTDDKGRYSLPSWGPVKLPIGTTMRSYVPEILMFKEGYEFKYLKNIRRPIRGKNIVVVSDWGDKEIGIRAAGKDIVINLGRRVVSRQGMRLRSVLGEYVWTFVHQECQWRRLPIMTRAFYREADKYRIKGIFEPYDYLNQFMPKDNKADTCGLRSFLN